MKRYFQASCGVYVLFEVCEDGRYALVDEDTGVGIYRYPHEVKELTEKQYQEKREGMSLRNNPRERREKEMKRYFQASCGVYVLFEVCEDGRYALVDEDTGVGIYRYPHEVKELTEKQYQEKREEW